MFFEKNSDYVIPDKWKEFDDWNERGFGSLKRQIVYFKAKPEEMYYVTFSQEEIDSFQKMTLLLLFPLEQ